MKKTTSLLLTSLTIYFFGITEQAQSQILKQKAPITLINNNLDYRKVGFELVQDDESIGIKSILLQDTVIYLVDTFHSNIKKINLITNKLSASIPLNKSRAWLRDIVVFDNKLFVVTDLRTNYILDFKLNILKTFQLPLGNKAIYKVFADSLLVNSIHEIYTIDKNGRLIRSKKDEPDVSKMTHGKTYQISNNGKVINTSYGAISLEHSIPYTSIKYFDAINIDFDDKNLVYFEVNPKSLKIFSVPIH